MKIKISTIVRAIMLIVVLINVVCKAAGKPIIDIDEGTVTYYLEIVIEIAVIIVGFWKNNSFSKKAIKADEFLNQLKNEEVE